MNENNTQPSGAKQPTQPKPLDVSVKITPSKEDGNLLAFANVTLGGCFAVTGIRVMDSDKGVFVAMPDVCPLVQSFGLGDVCPRKP